MMPKQSGTLVETKSLGCNRAGMPSFVSAVSKAYRPAKTHRERRKIKMAINPKGRVDHRHAHTAACVKNTPTHQTVILMCIIFGEGAEISGGEEKGEADQQVTPTKAEREQVLDWL